MSDEAQTNDTNPTPPAPARSFDAFVGPHLPVLLRVAGSLCRNPHDAEDLVQDTLIRAFKGLDGFDGTYPRAWLLTIMRNANINRHRRQRSGLLHDATDLEGVADRRNAPSPSAEDVAATGRRHHGSPMHSRASLHGISKRSASRVSTASHTTKPPPRSASPPAPS